MGTMSQYAKTNFLSDRYFSKMVLTLLICLLPAMLPAGEADETISVTYTFERPQIQKTALGAEIYDRIIMPGAPNEGVFGHPLLPATGAEILLPHNSEVAGINIVYGDRILLGSDYAIEPAGRPIPLSKIGTGVAVIPVPDEAIYGSDNPYPGVLYENIGPQRYRGYDILILKLNPVEYKPLSGELYYYPEIEVEITLADASRDNDMFRGLPQDRHDVINFVDNPDVEKTYKSSGINRDDYDLLIITTSDLEASFVPLQTYHDAEGIITDIVTTDDIGSLDPTVIRDYIRTRYQDDGIEYVLIGADDDLIHAIDLYVRSWDGSSAEVVYDMPADHYFGCLDGTYNYDGDTWWGERTDGEGGGEVDLIAEVSVGRASVGGTAEADIFVNKTLAYLNSGDPYLEKVLMVGEYLGFGGVSDYAASSLEECIDYWTTHSMSTYGIPSDIYDIFELYDRDWAGNDWPQSELVTRINEGVNILNHFGHGSIGSAMKLTSSEVYYQIQSTKHCVIYSQTCLAGHFDNAECWAEYMTIKSEYGAFAAVMNARYGWGYENSTDGPSQRYNRQFLDAIFRASEDCPQLGKANHDSKHDNIYRINSECMRWCYYELNLLGDPTVKVKLPPVIIAADINFGQIPLDVNFTGTSNMEDPVDTWTWDFGDEEYAYEQSPLHTYDEPGIYDVSLETDIGGQTYQGMRNQYIAVVADTVKAVDTEGNPGVSVALPIYACNTVPLKTITIPIEYSGALDIVYDSFSTVGCRTEYFEEQSRDYLDINNKYVAIVLHYSNSETQPELGAGSGLIANVYFTIQSSESRVTETTIETDGFNEYLPNFVTSFNEMEYNPIPAAGTISLAYMCGDVDGDELINILDIVSVSYTHLRAHET